MHLPNQPLAPLTVKGGKEKNSNNASLISPPSLEHSIQGHYSTRKPDKNEKKLQFFKGGTVPERAKASFNL